MISFTIPKSSNYHIPVQFQEETTWLLYIDQRNYKMICSHLNPHRASQVAQIVKNLPAMWEIWV